MGSAMEAPGFGTVTVERWTKRDALATCLPLELWPTVAETALDPSAAAKFRANKEAITLYFSGLTGREIEQRTGVIRSSLASLARKCLQLASDGRIFGFRALIPYVRTRPNVRRAKFSEKRTHQQGGQSGALNAILQRFPMLEDILVRRIRNEAKALNILEFRIAPKTLHKVFLEFLKANGVGEHEWPFNTRYQGVRTIQRFMSRVLHDNFARSVNVRGEKPAKAHLQTGSGDPPFLTFDEPYDAVEIDAYRIDAFLSVAFQTPEGTETDLLLERLWLIAIVDRASTAVLGHNIVYRSEITSDDVVRTIGDAISKRWEPRKLTIPARYPSGGGLPNGVIPEALGACWSVVLLDGALAHLAKVIHEEVRKKLGVVLSWGASGHFERRPNVERTFNEIAKNIFKRLPSTTGANPLSGRAPDAEKKAIRYKIRATLAEEATDVYIAQHNATPCEGISFLTPIEFIRYFLEERPEQFMLRRLPKALRDKTNMFSKLIQVTVRGGLSAGRRPYIQLDRGHYTSPVLRELGNLVGKDILVEVVDEDDYRQLKAYLLNGAEIGFLTVQGRWAHTKHSRRTRKLINSLISRRIITISEFDDPILKTLEYLSTPKEGKKAKDPPLSARQATDATRIAREAGIAPTISESQKSRAAKVVPKSTRALQHRHSILAKPMPTKTKVKNHK